MTPRTKAWVVAAIVVIAVGVSAGLAVQGKAEKSRQAAASNKDRPPLEFAASDIVQLVHRPLAVEMVLPGTVLALSQATVRSKLSAEVRRVTVREGDRVVPGQTLVEFDTAQLQVQLAERRATLESARAQLAQTDRTRQTSAQLVKQNFVSQTAFDNAEAALRAQAAAVEAAQAQLAQTQLQLNDAVVRAPIGGQIARRHVQPGEKTSFDAPLVAIVDLAQLEVQAQAPISDVARIQIGARAEVEIEGLPGRTFAGRVERINPSAESGTRMISVYVALANERVKQSWLLRSGMFARARLHLGEDEETAALPVSAIQDDGGQPIVWVIADGRLAKRAVTLGRRDERAQLIEVLSGVSAADRVIATKFDNLRDGLLARILGGAPGDSKVAGDAQSDAASPVAASDSVRSN